MDVMNLNKRIAIFVSILIGLALMGCRTLGSSSLLFSIIRSDSPEEVSEALKTRISVKDRDKDGWTPLMIAAAYSNNPEVDFPRFNRHILVTIDLRGVN